MELNYQTEPRPLVRKLRSVAQLSAEDERALLDLPLTVKVVEADADIVRDRDRPSACCLVLDGFVARYKLLPDGRRQIFSFHTPGDIPDLQSLHLKVMDHNLASVTRSTLAFIAHPDLRELCGRRPVVAAALWRDTLIDGAIFRAWMLGLGRRAALQRVAHLMCEMHRRLSAVGLVADGTFKLPLTQAEIADALGLSSVHVNRVMRELEKEGLVEMRASTVSIRDLAGLAKAGEFDPLYLHQEQDGNA